MQFLYIDLVITTPVAVPMDPSIYIVTKGLHYSITKGQHYTYFTISLFQYGVNLGDMQFLYIDLVITTTVAVLSKYSSFTFYVGSLFS